MATNTSELSAVSRLFSSSVFHEMAKKGRSALFARLFVQSGVVSCSPDQTVGDAFNAAFEILRRLGFRNEYVYRAAVTHNILLGTHSINTASMLTEFRAGECKADLVILNGTATVYEIKSERDSLVRLANQINNYRKVFAKIYVIAAEPHISDIVRNAPVDVGVMCLSRWDRITMVRDASNLPAKVCPVTIFESLRLAEARFVLNDLGVPVPDLPNTMLHAAMRDCFSRLSGEDVHRSMVKILKQTRDLAPFSALLDRLPKSLQPAALSIQIRRVDHDRLVEAVSTPLSSALAWV